MAAAKSSGSSRTSGSSKKKPAKKTAAKKRTSSAKKAPAKKTSAAKKSTHSKKSTAKKSAKPAKKPASRASAPKKAAGKKAPAKKTSAAKKSSTASKKSTAKKPAKPAKKPATSNGPEIPAPRGTTKDGISYTKDFDVKFLKAQRDELNARRAAELARATRLEDEATSLIEDGEMGDVQFDDEGGEGDTMVVQRDLDRVLSSQSRQTVSEIDAALDRIEAGTYGYSEVSGQPIPRERLEAIPETTVLAAEKVGGIGPR
ncbi:MAG: hypothetical protein AAGF73_01450 [Actinomycetota bacterium]